MADRLKFPFLPSHLTCIVDYSFVLKLESSKSVKRQSATVKI